MGRSEGAMSVTSKAAQTAKCFMLGVASSILGFVFTVLYLTLLWRFTDPRWGLPFLWFIPHGIKGLHFHHDIEFIIITPMMMFLARSGRISKVAAYIITTFFFGMALHHWWTEGLVIVSYSR